MKRSELEFNSVSVLRSLRQRFHLREGTAR